MKKKVKNKNVDNNINRGNILRSRYPNQNINIKLLRKKTPHSNPLKVETTETYSIGANEDYSLFKYSLKEFLFSNHILLQIIERFSHEKNKTQFSRKSPYKENRKKYSIYSYIKRIPIIIQKSYSYANQFN